MKEELRVINALIGMAQGSPGWPSLLRDHGFTVTAIERDVSVRDYSPRGLITPEAIFFSGVKDHALAAESKSATFSEKQGGRYAALSGEDLVGMGLIPEQAGSQVIEVSPVYFCAATHSDTMASQLAYFNSQRGTDLPLVAYSNHEFRLVQGTIRFGAVHEAFNRGVPIDEHQWPTGFVPFDGDSPVVDLLGPVIQEFLQILLYEGVESFTAEQFAGGGSGTGSQGCVPAWERLGPNRQSRICSRLAELIEQLRISYFDNFIAHEGPRVWKKKRSLSTRAMPRANERLSEFRILVGQGLPLPAGGSKDVLGQLDVEDVAE